MDYPSNNTRAIVGYLDDKQDQFAMFRIFLNSIELINAEDTDLVIFYHPYYAPVFENSDSPVTIGNNHAQLILVQTKPLASYDDDFKAYPYINSIACLVNQDWLRRYRYILKTDVDVVLTPRWNSYYPKGFETGLGGYNHDDNTKQQLKNVAERLQLTSGTTYYHNIGSTWYGNSDDIIRAADLTVNISRELLMNEFRYFTGEWPGFFRGVTLLYASEIAVNYLVDDIMINADELDVDASSQDSISNHTHIHFMHCVEPFSKHAFLQGEYSKIDIQSLNRELINEYCLYCALTSF